MIAFAVDIRNQVDQFVLLEYRPTRPGGDLRLLIADSRLRCSAFLSGYDTSQTKCSAVVFPAA